MQRANSSVRTQQEYCIPDCARRSPMPTPLILASQSPRRKELLRAIGLTFTAVPADVDERPLPGEQPEPYVRRISQDKARVVAQKRGPGIVIAADTIVTLDNAILGKPVDAQDAARMLTALSGRVHEVITGLTVMDAETTKSETRAACTRVRFRTLDTARIEAYVRTGEPLDKAGAYGIQEKGALLVDRIEGCYFNVVGLPLSLLETVLADFGIAPW